MMRVDHREISSRGYVKVEVAGVDVGAEVLNDRVGDRSLRDDGAIDKADAIRAAVREVREFSRGRQGVRRFP